METLYDCIERPPVHRRPLATEVAAANVVAPAVPSIRVEVLTKVRRAGDEGHTNDELMAWHAQAHGYVEAGNSGTIGTRVTELRRGGFVVAKCDGEGKPVTRPNRRGNAAQVWIATAKEGDGSKVEKLFP
jgi:hypothetical protein